MSAVLLAAMIACFTLLPASLVAYRNATVSPEEKHDPADCRHCAALRHPSHREARSMLARFPRQGGAR
ncbi:hypothetical protein [Streptomyces halobius]|uniref:Uncharacterized protein n=1 Tax=Streptomyces halobius TaxID=2879846 RepID=A0ABY4MEI3_9ACTN|nr:hypothetical protein [Streptomyces halobius]UQA95732.1 hypothetical protein K9S39_31150 [Streptomyces halobius]